MVYLLIAIKAIANTAESVLIRKYCDRYTSGSMLFTGVISLFAMIFFLVTDADGFHPSVYMLPYSILFGAVYCISYLLTFSALACGPFALSMLIISYSMVFPVLYGVIVLKEAVTNTEMIGFLLLAISLFLVRGNKNSGEHKVSVKWIILISIVCVGNGILSIIQKMQQIRFVNGQNNEFMSIALALSAAFLIILGFVKNGNENLKIFLCHGLPYAGSAGICNGVNNLLMLSINDLIQISISLPLITGAKMLASYICSRLIFNETYNTRQCIGVFTGIAALICLGV